MEFVELERRFRRLTDADLEDTERFTYWDQQGLGPGIAWPELLEHDRVVLLAEAGAGKTDEMKERARRLVEEGRFAFFLRLEFLDKEPTSDILSSDEVESFKAWKADKGAPAWFFLDAVDELKLIDGRLARAFRRLSKDLDGHIHRVRVIISCRPSDWRPVIDLATVKDWLPVSTEGGENTQGSPDDYFLNSLKNERRQDTGTAEEGTAVATSTAVQMVAMLPMDEQRIRRFAEHSGVVDTTAFIDEIDPQNAGVFAGRPLDLSDLIANWSNFGRLGTRKQQHETNATGKLKDHLTVPIVALSAIPRPSSGQNVLPWPWR